MIVNVIARNVTNNPFIAEEYDYLRKHNLNKIIFKAEIIDGNYLVKDERLKCIVNKGYWIGTYSELINKKDGKSLFVIYEGTQQLELEF